MSCCRACCLLLAHIYRRGSLNSPAVDMRALQARSGVEGGLRALATRYASTVGLHTAGSHQALNAGESEPQANIFDRYAGLMLQACSAEAIDDCFGSQDDPQNDRGISALYFERQP